MDTAHLNEREGVDPLGTTAFIVVDEARCLYDARRDSAVRVIPPYGSEVAVVRDEGEWVKIRFCGKEAWSLRDHLSPVMTGQKEAVRVGVVPGEWSGATPRRHALTLANAHEGLQTPLSLSSPPSLHVEVGPRGGRFVRTRSGFRRYL